jgi:hypothetical protein
MNRFLVLALALGGCGNDEVVGPFTGETHRFVVDHFTVPTTSVAAHALGDDFNNDGDPDNAIGAVVASLYADHDITPYSGEMLASGAITSSVEIQTLDVKHPETAGVRYFGAIGAAATVMGGTFDEAGNFTSNRTATTTASALGAATIVLPVFIDADPSTLELQHAEVDLTPDGAGGYDARFRGLVTTLNARHVAAVGLAQMINSNPKDHGGAFYFVNTIKDDHVTVAEIEASNLITSLLAPDIKGGDNGFLSVAFEVHLAPCEAGSCSTAAPVDTCHDRIRDNDETGVDCGGPTCAACGESGTCMTGSDCLTGACDSGTCRDWSCHDGKKDGFEPSTDCGVDIGCGQCRGGACVSGPNCASGSCINNVCQ